MAKTDFIEILQDIRGTQLTKEEAAQSRDNIYGDITYMYDEITGLAIGDNLDDITTVSDNIGSVVSVADDLALGANSEIVKVNNNKANIDAVSANELNINTVANNSDNINTVSTMDTDIDTVILMKDNIDTTADAVPAINAIVQNIDDINTVSGNNSNITIVANDTVAINDVSSEPLRSAILDASQHGDDAQLKAWKAEAERLTADSYATEPEDVLVKLYTTNGDGTFTATPTTEYSALHYAAKSEGNADNYLLKTTYDITDNGIVDNSESLEGNNSAWHVDRANHTGTQSMDTITESATGKIFTDVEREAHNKMEGMLHGLFHAGSEDLITINVDPTKYDVLPFTYYIDGVKYEYAGETGRPSGFTLGNNWMTIGIGPSGIIELPKEDFYTPVNLVGVLELGGIGTDDGTNISFVGQSHFDIGDFHHDVATWAKFAKGTEYIGTAGSIGVNGTNALQLDIAGGTIIAPELAAKTITGGTAIGMRAYYNVGGVPDFQAVQTPFTVSNTQYDDGNELALAGNNKWMSHNILRSSRTGTIYYVPSQGQFDNLADAIDAPISLGGFEGKVGVDVTPLAKVIIQKDAVAIESVIDKRNEITNVVSASTSTLQTTYERSIEPEIVTNATRGALTITGGTGVDTNANLEIKNNAGTLTASISADGTLVVQDVIINGDTTQINSTTVTTQDNLIVINDGETGPGVTAGSAGFIVDRGTATNYEFKFDETDDSFKVGEVGSLQAVATREDSPIDTGMFYWDNATSRLVSTRNIDVDSITVSGNVDGRDVSVDGAKLDGIEAGATADQVWGEITGTLANQTDLIQAQGYIMNPDVHLPLTNSLDFEKGNGFVNFSRADTKTYVDRLGVLKTELVDEPVFDKFGYRNSVASTNIVLNSGDLSVSPWSGGNWAIGVETSLDPFGITSVQNLVSPSTSSKIQNPTIIGNTYTASVYLKSAGAGNDDVSIRIGSEFFDITVTSEWVRYSFTTTALSNDAGIRSSATGTNIFAWGYQLEELPFATPYIPTLGTSATRAADSLTLDSLDNMHGILDPITVMLDVEVIGTSEVGSEAFDSSDLRLFVSDTAANDNVSFVRKSGASRTTNYTMPTNKFRFGATYNPNTATLRMYHDGVLVSEDTSASTSDARSSLITLMSGVEGYLTNLRIWNQIAFKPEWMALG